MKKVFTLLSAGALISVAIAAFASERIALRPVKKVDLTGKAMIASTAPTESAIPKAPTKSVTRQQIILEEDFSNIPAGNTEIIEGIGEHYTDLIASSTSEPGPYINADYTPESGRWYGDWVYAGKDGTVILQPVNPQVGGNICTPLGDYSGDITVNIRCRCAKTFWLNEADEYVTSPGSTLQCSFLRGGYDSFESCETDATQDFLSQRLYENDG